MKSFNRSISLYLLIGLCLFQLSATAQRKSEKVYIVNDRILSEDSIKQMNPNKIKALRMISNEDELAELAKRHGDRIKESYVMAISLYSDEEMKTRPQATTQTAGKLQITQDTEEKATLIHVGDQAPDFNVQMLDGTTIKLSDLKGKVVLLNFWATWCSPCMMEFEEIPEKIIKQFNNNDFVLLPISRGETKEIVSSKMEKLKLKGIDFKVGLDPDKSIFTRYATQFIPRNFLIDKNGKVVYCSVGYGESKMNDLINEIKKLCK